MGVNKGSTLIGLLLAAALLTAGITGCDNNGPSVPDTTLAETVDSAAFQEDFGFRGKQVGPEEGGNLIGGRVPLPAYLPEGHSVQEIYVGVGNSMAIILISSTPIEKVNREPPDEPKDYPIHLVKCE
jgi:hypothetical protein